MVTFAEEKERLHSELSMSSMKNVTDNEKKGVGDKM